MIDTGTKLAIVVLADAVGSCDGRSAEARPGVV
jgi:hypothetical protein